MTPWHDGRLVALTDEQFGWWLAGLVDGEGHFGITRRYKENGAGPYFRCVFRVSMVVADYPMLEAARRRTGWGRVYQYGRKTENAHGQRHGDVAIWTANTKVVGEVAEFFERFPLQSKKADEFAIWAPAARAHAARPQHGPRDPEVVELMADAYDRLREMRGHPAWRLFAA